MAHPFIEKWLPQRDHLQGQNTYLVKSTNDPEGNDRRPSKRDTGEMVEFVVSEIERYQLDLTIGYSNWRDLGFAIAEEFGEAGRSYFHRISRFNPGYNPGQTDKQYDRAISGKGSGITIRSFFYAAKNAGIPIKQKVFNQ